MLAPARDFKISSTHKSRLIALFIEAGDRSILQEQRLFISDGFVKMIFAIKSNFPWSNHKVILMNICFFQNKDTNIS